MRRSLKGYMLLAAALLLLLLGGCGAPKQAPVREEEQEEPKVQIGLSFDSFVIERWTRDRDVFVSTAQGLGAQVNVQTANGDVQEQISQIEYFIKKKMDVIVIIAIDGDALTDVVRKAMGEGIRVVCYDRLIMNAGTDLYISFDNEQVGTLMGEALRTALPEGGNLFCIYGSQSDHNVRQVQDGLFGALEGSDLRVVYSSYCDNWLAELAFDAVNEGLEREKNVAGIMCGNDDLASQAIRALSEHRMAGKVIVVAQDAELSACQRIVEGTQEMTVYKSVETLAKKAAEFATALGYERLLEEGRMKEEELAEEIRRLRAELAGLDTINDGGSAGFRQPAGDRTEENGLSVEVELHGGERKTSAVEAEVKAGGYEVPCYLIQPEAVTRDNMDELIIGTGFHTEEDVYLNTDRN